MDGPPVMTITEAAEAEEGTPKPQITWLYLEGSRWLSLSEPEVQQETRGALLLSPDPEQPYALQMAETVPQLLLLQELALAEMEDPAEEGAAVLVQQLLF